MLGAREEYAALAKVYDERWSRYVQESTRHTIAAIQGSADQRLLDVGCGTGVLLQQLMHRTDGPNLVGLDLSLEMLRAAETRLDRSAALFVGDAARLPFAEASFDVVVSVSSLHYWPEPAAGISEAFRVLRPGGRFIVTDWCGDAFVYWLLELWLRVSGKARVRVYTVEECSRMLSSSGFGKIRWSRYRADRVWPLMTLHAQKPLA